MTTLSLGNVCLLPRVSQTPNRLDDNRNRNRYDFPMVSIPHLKWEYMSSPLLGPPCLVNDSVILLSRGGIISSHRIHNGKAAWHTDIGKLTGDLKPNQQGIPRFIPSLCSASSGKHIYASISNSAKGIVVCINRDSGKIKWYVSSSYNGKDRGPVWSGPVLDGERLFFRTGGGLTAVRSADGKELWNSFIDPNAAMTGVMNGRLTVQDNKVFIGADLGTIHAFRVTDGKKLWSVATEGLEQINIPMYSDTKLTPTLCRSLIFNDLLLTSDGLGYLYAVRLSDGHLLWKKKYYPAWQFIDEGATVLAVTSSGLARISPKDGSILKEYLIKGGFQYGVAGNRQAILVRNSFVNPGWELFDLHAWKPVWNNTALFPYFGMSVDKRRLVLAGGLPNNSLPGQRVEPSRMKTAVRLYELTPLG